MADEQSEKLALLQQVTGNDNLDECRRVLEDCNWDLEIATATVLQMMGNDFDNTSSSSSSSSSRQSNHPTFASSSSSSSKPSASSSSSSSSSSPTTTNSSRVYSSIQRQDQNIMNYGPYPIRLIVNWGWTRFWSLGRTILSIFSSFGARERINDPAASSARFLLNFEQSFGRVHPTFYQGSYTDALREAQQNFQFLLAYLHCDEHQDTESFCRQVLTNPNFIAFVNENNLIFWGGNINENEPFHVSQTLGVSYYPFLCLIGQKGSKMTILSRIDGITPVNDLITKLGQLVQTHGASVRAAKADREHRERERELRQQQQEEFQQSLREDEEKERRAEEERMKQERQIEEQKRLEMEEKMEEERQAHLREQKRKQLGQEPNPDEEMTTLIIFRLPNSSKVQRRFRETDTIKTLYDYIETQDINCKSFVVCKSYPKKVFNDKSQTLYDAGVCPNALVIVEEFFE